MVNCLRMNEGLMLDVVSEMCCCLCCRLPCLRYCCSNADSSPRMLTCLFVVVYWLIMLLQCVGYITLQLYKSPVSLNIKLCILFLLSC